MASKRKIKKEAKRELEDLRLTLRRARKSADPETVEEADRLGSELRESIKSADADRMKRCSQAVSDYVDENLSDYRPNQTWETVKALIVAGLVALFIRWGFIEPFRIPSGSMIPTLLIGDQLLVNKMSYGPDIYYPVLDPDFSAPIEERADMGAPLYTIPVGDHQIVIVAKKMWMRRLPERGEVVVFRYPRKPREDYIKRVIGLPGDTVELRNGELYINGDLQEKSLVGDYDGPVGSSSCDGFDLFMEKLTREEGTMSHELIYCEEPGWGMHNSYGPATVPEGMLFMMGDNRDQSADSRSWGYAPAKFLKGEALVIHLPLNPDNHYLPRWGRFFKPIK